MTIAEPNGFTAPHATPSVCGTKRRATWAADNLKPGCQSSLGDNDCAILFEVFRRCQCPSMEQHGELAHQIGVTEHTVRVWFQNCRERQNRRSEGKSQHFYDSTDPQRPAACSPIIPCPTTPLMHAPLENTSPEVSPRNQPNNMEMLCLAIGKVKAPGKEAEDLCQRAASKARQRKSNSAGSRTHLIWAVPTVLSPSITASEPASFEASAVPTHLPSAPLLEMSPPPDSSSHHSPPACSGDPSMDHSSAKRDDSMRWEAKKLDNALPELKVKDSVAVNRRWRRWHSMEAKQNGSFVARVSSSKSTSSCEALSTRVPEGRRSDSCEGARSAATEGACKETAPATDGLLLLCAASTSL